MINKGSVLRVLILGITIISCSSTKNSKLIEVKMENSNKEKAVALLNSFNTGDQEPISYINPKKYIQHNLGIIQLMTLMQF